MTTSETPAAPGSVYDAAYYQSHCGPVPYDRSEPQWPAVFGGFADRLIQTLHPARVLDVGCAFGFLVEAFWDRGVEAWGLDISAYALEQVRPDMRKYCRVASATDPIENGPFDLITCIEVVEHLTEQEALAAIDRMTGATNTLLFSSSPYDLTEPTHVNVRPLFYWLNAFQEHGFSPDILFDASFVCPHAMLLRKRPVGFPADVLRLFASALHLRHLVSEKATQSNELARDLRQAKAETTQIEGQLESALMEIADMRRASAAQASVAQNTEAGLRQEIEQLAVLQEELEAVRRERDTARAALERAEITNDQIRDDLDLAANRITGYLAESRKEAGRKELLAQGAVMELRTRLQTLEHQMAGLSATMNSILNSRIWRTLVRGGGWIQMLSRSRRDR